MTTRKRKNIDANKIKSRKQKGGVLNGVARAVGVGVRKDKPVAAPVVGATTVGGAIVSPGGVELKVDKVEIPGSITNFGATIKDKFEEIKKMAYNTTDDKKKKEDDLIDLLNRVLAVRFHIRYIEKEKELAAAAEAAVAVAPGPFTPDVDMNKLFIPKQLVEGPDITPEDIGELIYDDRNDLVKECINLLDIILTYIKNNSIDMKYRWVRIVSSHDEPELISRVGILKDIEKGIANPKDKLASVKGDWLTTVWFPNDGDGVEVKIPRDGAESFILSVITDEGGLEKPLQKFLTLKPYLYSIMFLPQKKYDINSPTNYKPKPQGSREKEVSLTQSKKGYIWNSKGIEVAQNVSYLDGAANIRKDIAKGLIRKPGEAISALTTRSLRGKYKIEIKKILDSKANSGNADEKHILNKKIRYGNDRQLIRDLLVNKISSIFTDGQTVFNPFNTEKLNKNFADDGGEETGEGGEEEGKEEKEEKGLRGGSLTDNPTTLVGGGIYGFRDFDLTDARLFVDLILKSLIEINNVPGNKDLLLKTYLKTLFSRIGPSTLNKILPNIETITKVSVQVIKHFARNLEKDNDSKKSSKQRKNKGEKGEEGEGEGEGEESEGEDEEPAQIISGLNLALNYNVKTFIKVILDITLSPQQLTGNSAVIENYLNDNYNNAMKKPSGDEKRRIENNELRQALNRIFGPDLSSIELYRAKIIELDKQIDSMNTKNISEMLQKMKNAIPAIADVSQKGIVYILPDKVQAILADKESREGEAGASGNTDDNLRIIAALNSYIERLQSDDHTANQDEIDNIQRLVDRLDPKTSEEY
jgi:hypothetical protein